MPFNLQDLACTKISLFVKNKQEKTRETRRLHIHLCKLANKLALKTPCGSSRDELAHVLLSECNADISAHLASCHLSKCSDVTEVKLIISRAGIQHLSSSQLKGWTICPRQRHLLGRFWRGPRSCQYPDHTGKIASVKGSHIITFKMADEIKLIFQRNTAVGSLKYTLASVNSCGESRLALIPVIFQASAVVVVFHWCIPKTKMYFFLLSSNQY